VEEGEDPAACIAREIREELGGEVAVVRRLADVEHDYGDTRIRLFPFVCRWVSGAEPEAREHAELRWVTEGDFDGIDWVGADIGVVRRYRGVCQESDKACGFKLPVSAVIDSCGSSSTDHAGRL
jgi:8-oxo-dGTP diphosphatase